MPPVNAEKRFSPTITIVLRGSEPERAQATEHIIAAHWKPLYKYLRARYPVSHTEAWTIALNFFSMIPEKSFFDGFESGKMSLREYLRRRIDQFVASPLARTAVPPSSLFDFAGAEEEFQADKSNPRRSAQEYYEGEWVRHLFTVAVVELNNKLITEGKHKEFAVFMRHDLQDRTGNDRIGLENIAEELAIPLNDVIDSLANTRRRFQSVVAELVRSFASSEGEFRKEMQIFFGG